MIFCTNIVSIVIELEIIHNKCFKGLTLSGNRIMGCFPTWIQHNTNYIGNKLETLQSVI